MEMTCTDRHKFHKEQINFFSCSLVGNGFTPLFHHETGNMHLCMRVLCVIQLFQRQIHLLSFSHVASMSDYMHLYPKRIWLHMHSAISQILKWKEELIDFQNVDTSWYIVYIVYWIHSALVTSKHNKRMNCAFI